MPVSTARPQLSCRFSRPTRHTAYELFTPNNSGQRSHPTCYRGCWHVVGRCFFHPYRHPKASSRSKEVYNPKAVIPHAASLRQASAHCAIFPTAASRRSLGRVSVPVWPDALSGRLPVEALVGHHPTNKLIGRGPIPSRKNFPPHTMQHEVISGIRPSFPGLSQSLRQVTHVLLTRSPLVYPRKGLTVRLACVKHAASVRPEPGSNSPNKNQKTLFRTIRSRHQYQTGKKTTPPTREAEGMAKTKNNKQKPPNTLLSSQTTSPFKGNPAIVLDLVRDVKPRPPDLNPGPWVTGNSLPLWARQSQT